MTTHWLSKPLSGIEPDLLPTGSVHLTPKGDVILLATTPGAHAAQDVLTKVRVVILNRVHLSGNVSFWRIICRDI